MSLWWFKRFWFRLHLCMTRRSNLFVLLLIWWSTWSVYSTALYPLLLLILSLYWYLYCQPLIHWLLLFFVLCLLQRHIRMPLLKILSHLVSCANQVFGVIKLRLQSLNVRFDVIEAVTHQWGLRVVFLFSHSFQGVCCCPPLLSWLHDLIEICDAHWGLFL
jgi:hypothetical protein